MDGLQSILSDVDGMQQLPLMQCAWNEGIAYRQLLVRVTGLTESRLSQGGLERLRSSTLAKGRARVYEASRLAGRSELEQKQLMKQWASPEMEGAAGWAAYVTSMESATEGGLPMLICHAVALDRRVTALQNAALTGDFDQLRALSSSCATEYAFLNEPELQEGHWAGIDDDWAKLHLAVRILLGTWWADFHAALDAEWGQVQIQGLTPTPLFNFVLPRCPALIGRSALGWREFTRSLRRPVRRLLELLYVMQHRAGRGFWPSGPPGPSELARAASEEESSITNYFDGTKKLRLQGAQAIWDRLSEHFGARSVGFPTAIAATAICWQRAYIPQDLRKATKIVFPGAQLHEILWQRHRARLPEASGVSEPWPAWLTD